MVFAAASVETTSAFIEVGFGAAVCSAALDVAFFDDDCALAAPAAASAIMRARAIFFTVPPGVRMNMSQGTCAMRLPADPAAARHRK
jgi:hypothetical protein